MTIEFNCPWCGALIAFDGKHSGKCAKCLSCERRFVVPAESFQKPRKVEPEPSPKEDPIPGFSRAVFLDSWNVFLNRQHVTTLAFVVAVVCFRFFLAPACCLNYLSNFVIWGWLFGFYLNVISHTAIDDDQLPEIDIGTSVTFLLYILGPFFVFFYTLFLVELPFIIGLSLTQGSGVTFEHLWSGSSGLHRLLQRAPARGPVPLPGRNPDDGGRRDLLPPAAGLPPGPPAAGSYALPDHRRPVDRCLCPGNARRPVRLPRSLSPSHTWA